MKTFTEGLIRALDGEGESLCDVVGVDVLKGRAAVVGERDYLAAREAGEDLRIEMARGVDRVPARAGDVAGMQDGRGEAAKGFVQKEALDLRLPDAVVAERL